MYLKVDGSNTSCSFGMLVLNRFKRVGGVEILDLFAVSLCYSSLEGVGILLGR